MADEIRVSGPVWLVGCGNMAGAMLRRWLDVGLPRELVTVIRPSGVSPVPGVRAVTSLPRDEAPPHLLLLGVKPQKLDDVSEAVASVVGPQTLLVSILAGTETATLRTRFPKAGHVVRAMPNLPVAIGRGVVGLYGDAGGRKAGLDALMAPLGASLWVENEDLLHAIAALAGSGPAFVFRFIAALAAGGEALGLPADDAQRLAIAMVDGAAGLAASSGEGPDILADRVTSPGGMTRKGLDVLDDGHALKNLTVKALVAADARSREMAAETR